MINRQQKKAALRARRRQRVKKRFNRFDGKLRLVVNRSARHISGQIVDDSQGRTVISASTIEKALAPQLKGAKSKTEQAELIGKTLAERAAKKKISQVVFDRNGHVFHGRVKALAKGASDSGLKI